MQSFIDFLTGLVILLAAAALAQFGIDLNGSAGEAREIHRTADDDCADAPASRFSASDRQDC